MIEEKVAEFIKNFSPQDKYTFFGLSPELVYFLSILKKNSVLIEAAAFSDLDLKDSGVSSLSKHLRRVTDVVGQRELANYESILLVRPDEIDPDSKIIVTSDMYRREIFQLLESKGLKRDVHYCLYKDALAYWTYGLHRRSYIHRVDQFVTSRCTLNCTYCNMYIPYFEKPKDRSFEQLKGEADLFFSKIDTLGIFHIVGGEPLLNKDIEKYVEYLGSTYYGSKFHNFWITSNGTVAPSSELVELLNKYQVFISVTDYSQVLPHIARKTKRALSLYNDHHINHLHNREKSWIDFGDPRKAYVTDETKLKRHFQKCTVPFRGLANDRFYYCNLSVGADESGAKPARDGDYLTMSPTSSALEMVWFDLGNVPRGYVALCEGCAGCNTGIGEEVPAGASQGLRPLS